MLGVDVAGGGRNKSVMVLRAKNGAKVIYREDNPDTMAFVGEILKQMDLNKVRPENVFVDAIGVGKGVFDRLTEQTLRDRGSEVNAIIGGQSPENKEEFEGIMAGISLANIGQVTGGEVLEIYGVEGRKVLAASIGELKEAWQKPIRW